MPRKKRRGRPKKRGPKKKPRFRGVKFYRKAALVDAPVYKPGKLGRPVKYDFTPLLRHTVHKVVFEGASLKDYPSVRVCAHLFKKKHNLEYGLEFDIMEPEEDAKGIGFIAVYKASME